MAGSVRLSHEGAVATLTLDSPGKLNAISVPMWRALRERALRIASDAAIRCVLVRGAGGNFAAGADIEEFASVRHDRASGRAYHLDILLPALRALAAIPQPVVAAIEGVCVGGGLEIAAACDIRVARAEARFGVPVGRLGFPLALPELAPLLKLVGPALLSDLLLSGRLLSANEALTAGLVQRVAPADRFEAEVASAVNGVLAGAPLAARQNKAQLRALAERGAYTEAELDASFAFLDWDDYKEGVAAFLAKRAPKFLDR
jgi:enoyl-CoA hydratase/carnithine racemase